MTRSPLATAAQADAERLALRLIERPDVRAAREAARAAMLADPIAATADGRLGLDRALDQWLLALAMRIVNADPWRPQVVWNVYNPPRRWFSHIYPGAAVAIDNPDNSNREMAIDGASTYRISGRFSAPAAQLTLELVTDFDGYAGIGRTLGALTSQAIVADADGRFTVTVGPEADGPNQLRTEPGSLWLFSRDSMADWTQDQAELTIERIAGPPAPPPRDEAAMAADIVASAPVWMHFWRSFKDDFLGSPEPNRLIGPIGRPGGWGFLYGGRFRLSGDEALVVTTIDGGAAYTGFQISDPWTISPDPVLRLASLNRAQARASSDGSYTYVVAARDPGVHNWIDTSGLEEGWLLLRWQGLPAGVDPATLVRSVEPYRLDALALPPDVPRVDLAGRSAQVAERVAGFARRFQH